jgi:hypothetical protein
VKGASKFYSAVFDWKVEVSPEPKYGGYATAKSGGKDVAGIAPKQMEQQPTAWTVYIGTANAAETAKNAVAAGGKIIAPAMEVGDQGHMAIIQDPSGAYLGLWQATNMHGAQTTGSNSMGWAELNARGFKKAEPFYKTLFGWGEKKSPMTEGQEGEYTEFQLHGNSIAGGMEMNPMVPAHVPSYWMVYFNVDNVDKSFDKVIAEGGKEMLSPQSMPGGRFAIVSDPQGATFGLLKMEERSK